MVLDFFLAKQKHRMWMINMKAFLLDLEDFDPNKIAAHTACDLGKWIYGFGIHQFADYAEFKQLEEKHKLLHEHILNIIASKNNGDLALAHQSFQQLELFSTDILNLLDQMEQISSDEVVV